MSDENENENEHEHPHGFAAFFNGPSREQLEQLQERAKMEQLAASHETRQFLDGLTLEQLKKLSALFNLAHTTEGESALYFMGLITGFIDLKFKVCLACGVDHDKELGDMIVPTESTKSSSPVTQYRTCCITDTEKPHTYECPNMVKFRVEPDDGGSLNVQCKNCKLWYSSLEDRMMRSPDKSGCHGCVDKEKWG